MFFYLYSLLALPIYILSLPLVLLLSFKSKYRRSLPARFFLWRNPPLKPDGIWLHLCSFGEARAVAPLVAKLPKAHLRMSATTQTGKAVIDGYTTQSRYLPFEPLLFFWMRPQRTLVVMEAELWYLLFSLAKRRGAKTILINARISDRSYGRYKRFAFLYRRIFAHIDKVFAQSEVDRLRLESLGARDVVVTGNLKLAALPQPKVHLQKPERLVLCAASTHEGEEEIVLQAFEQLKAQEEEAMLIVAPRHPERFDEVARLLAHAAKRHGYRFARESETRQPQGDLYLLDRLGALVDVYAISDIVIGGGSFVPVGGHNLAEAAQFSPRILSGPHYFNQRDLYGAIEGIVFCDASMLAPTLLRYKTLPKTRIVTRTQIEPILAEIMQ